MLRTPVYGLVPPTTVTDCSLNYITKNANNGSLTILSEVDIAVAGGEVVAIVGPSGSGKSTLLGILAGLDQPTGGTISMLQQPLNDMDEDERARLRAGKVGFVFQSFQLLPGLTALENVMLPLELGRNGNAKKAATQMLQPTGNLDGETGQRIIDLMFALRAEKGSALVLVTHDDKLAERCDRRLIMDSGHLQSA